MIERIESILNEEHIDANDCCDVCGGDLSVTGHWDDCVLMAARNLLAEFRRGIRARTTTPTPSPTEGRVPLPSGEQPGVGEIVDAAQDLLAALSGICLEGYGDQKECLAASKDRLYALIARARQQGSPSASQPRADYDAGESGEKI